MLIYFFEKLNKNHFVFLLDGFVVEVRMTLSDLNFFKFIMGTNTLPLFFFNNCDAEEAVTKVIIKYIFSSSNYD